MAPGAGDRRPAGRRPAPGLSRRLTPAPHPLAKRAASLLTAVTVILAGGTGSASADALPAQARPGLGVHAYLLRASPADGAVLDASPSVIELVFTESIQPDFVQFVLTRSGEPVPTSRPQVHEATLTVPTPRLEPGLYQVAWRVLGTDSHPMPDRLGFTVRDPARAAPGTSSTAAPTTRPGDPSSRPATAAATTAATATATATAMPQLTAARSDPGGMPALVWVGALAPLALGAGVLVATRTRRSRAAGEATGRTAQTRGPPTDQR